MAQPAAGHVVISASGKFLSRSRRWVKHRNRKRSSPGHKRAWVHPVEVIAAGGDWANEAAKLLPAVYDKEMDCTVVLGDPISFHEFVNRSSPQA